MKPSAARVAYRYLQATANREEWPAIFDSLKPRQRVYLAMTAVMGMSEATDGKFHEWTVYRRSRGRGYEAITLLQQDGSKPNKYNAYKLWKKTDRQGNEYVSASVGDMGIMLKGMKT